METVIKNLEERGARLIRDIKIQEGHEEESIKQLEQSKNNLGILRKSLIENDEALKILRGTNE